jgi:iron complex outermembrane receptor protein
MIKLIIKRLKTIINSLWRKSLEHSSPYYVWWNSVHLGYGKLLLSCVFVVLCCSQSGRVVATESDSNTAAKKAKIFNFDIPKQRADLSLISFAEQSNTTLLFPFDEMKNKQANRLLGQYTIMDGMTVLLENTDLKAEINQSGQLSILIKSNLKEEQQMNKMPKRSIIATLLAAIFAPSAANAQDSADAGADEAETVLIIGSRSQKTRTIADSPVPVDILNADDLNSIGGTADLTDNLKALIPSYTATPATGDGSAFVRPTSLRGTATDQTLVLIDGKRRHRSALVQFFAPAAGNGAHGADIGMIPAIALKRVEVLRDGAASQYGSDAIAGVINFVTKDAAEGGLVELQYGQHYEGESSMKFGANKGLSLGENGFANISLEYVDNDALSRGIIRPDAQALIDAGVQGVGADSPFGDAPFTQTWGRPETDALRVFINAGVDLANGKKLYARSNYADTSGRYRFFYRNTEHSILRQRDGNGDLIGGFVFDGFTGVQADVGFTPFLDGDQTDFSLVVGLKGEYENGTYYDFSVSSGSNELDYFLNNTINSDLGLTANLQIPQLNFDVGGYKQEEINLNADFSTPVGTDFNVAYGAEWREETYTVIAGEPNSSIGGGSSGFKGIGVNDSGEFDRDNYAVYLDVEQDVSENLFLQYALRYEDFSDFGSTVNWKIASRYTINETTAIRGAISTGFHAPTPGQSNVSTTITTFDGNTGLQVEEGLIPATDPRAVATGGQAIKEEESTSISFGITSDIGEDTTLTLDFYQIAVDDRIYRTGDIQFVDPNGVLPDQTISFYTNAIDVEHSGFDLVITTDIEWSEMTSTDISFAYGYNKIEVVGQRLVGGQTPVSNSTVEDIENNFPNSRFVLTGSTAFGDDWNLMLRANFYGSHFDERGEIGAATDPSAEIDSIVYIDAELGYQVSDELKVKLGFSNIFDSFIDEIDAPNANRQSVGLQYPRRSAANYEGGSWYLSASYQL